MTNITGCLYWTERDWRSEKIPLVMFEPKPIRQDCCVWGVLPKKNMFWIRNRTRGSKGILCCLKQVMCRVGWLLASGSSLPPPARWQWPRTDDVCDVPRRDRKQLDGRCWLTADEPGIQTPPDTLTHSANVEERAQKKRIYKRSRVITRLIFFIFISQGSKINFLSHLPQTAGLCYVSCALCWQPIVFVSAPVKATEIQGTSKPPARHECQWPISIGKAHFCRPCPARKLWGPDESSKRSKFISSPWRNSFLEWGFLISVRGWAGPNKDQRIMQKHNLSNCSAAFHSVALGLSLSFKVQTLVIILDNGQSFAVLSVVFIEIVAWLCGSWCWLPKCYRESHVVKAELQRGLGVPKL